MTEHVLDDLDARGLVAQATDRAALREHLSSGPVTLYCGFDPTAPSMHMGNLLQFQTLRRFQLAGHRPIGVVGGATGLVGDPKDTGERVLNPREVVAGWVERFREQLSRFWDFEGEYAARIIDNYEWTGDLPVLDFLRDIGKHFPVNRMLDREAVRARLDTGISYTEFSYVLLQSMDYLHLHRRYGVTLQTGGSDQWGNITAGVELIRRVDGARVHALATPLVTKTDGTKFGKTESGTVWLDPTMTSPYAFHQFWLNSADADIPAYLRFYSLRPLAEIEELLAEHERKPAARTAQRALADELTTLVHGAQETARVTAAAAALFGSGRLEQLDAATLDAALREVPHTRIETGEALPAYADLLATAGLVPSKSAARRTIADGGAYVNNDRIEDADAAPSPSLLLGGRWLVLRRGKRTVGGVEVVRAG